ncbi:hypothetical protein L1987_81004 [Smallanthus sonchifolius]|uniref:Uncharacterized protein n=1 Tax=Smallanthus sonchifolius TaxID=185202 RepID=A0ACB8YTH2_9ASTR|nr:hypothetical protein L1987_81004 [Smallanthus sonchifolius]
MVGIMVAKDWNLQEEIILKWRDKEYSVWCKKEEDDSCPSWCIKNQKSDSAAPAPSNQTTESAAPTKWPRMEKKNSDPFLLDDIIREFGRGGKESSKPSTNIQLTDLYSSMVASSSAIIDVRRESDFDEGGNPKSEEETRSVDQEELNNEIKATIE